MILTRPKQAMKSIVRIFAVYKADNANMFVPFAGSAVHSGKHLITAAHTFKPTRHYKHVIYRLHSIHYCPLPYAAYSPKYTSIQPNCTLSPSYTNLISTYPDPSITVFGTNLQWDQTNDIAVLDVDEEAPLVKASFDTPLTQGEEVHIIGYPSFLLGAQYVYDYSGQPPISYTKLIEMFGGFERKVLSKSIQPHTNPTDPPHILHTHHSNTLGGMSGSGVFVSGILRGIHIGGLLPGLISGSLSGSLFDLISGSGSVSGSVSGFGLGIQCDLPIEPSLVLQKNAQSLCRGEIKDKAQATIML
eukprot:Phypoly_transcript_05879.p1 GENE.Phypoly_transcript_05879~~Phypoly_transcript_05879.p1  ORF type:complete len:302 (-),score=15.30 Phypoly_transcript_05879:67-972(-)